MRYGLGGAAWAFGLAAWCLAAGFAAFGLAAWCAAALRLAGCGLAAAA